MASESAFITPLLLNYGKQECLHNPSPSAIEVLQEEKYIIVWNVVAVCTIVLMCNAGINVTSVLVFFISLRTGLSSSQFAKVT